MDNAYSQLRIIQTGQPVGLPDAAHLHLVGTILADKYQVTRLLTLTSTSAVYLAHEEIGNRLVSVKVLLASQALDSGLFDLAIKDAAAARAVSHPAIVSFDDYGYLDSGLPYVVMDYLRDVSLADLINRRQLTVKRSLGLLIQLCDALTYAHRCNVVHGDLKPSYVMVVTDGNGDNIRVVDFGLDRLNTGVHDPQLRLKDDVVLYRSPERFLSSQAEPCTDVYSLGCMMYEALTGEPPFQGTSEQVGLAHSKSVPPFMELSDQPVGVRRKLNEILLRSMAKSPQFRYQTTEQLKCELQIARSEMQDGYFKQIGRLLQSAVGLHPGYRKK